MDKKKGSTKMKKAAIFADNRAVYIAPNEKTALYWLHNDLLKECRAGYLYDVEEIDDEQEKALKEKDAAGYIFLMYPRIIREQ